MIDSEHSKINKLYSKDKKLYLSYRKYTPSITSKPECDKYQNKKSKSNSKEEKSIYEIGGYDVVRGVY